MDPIAVHDIKIVAGLRHRGIGVLISDHNVERLSTSSTVLNNVRGQVKSLALFVFMCDDTVADIYLGHSHSASAQRFSHVQEAGVAS